MASRKSLFIVEPPHLDYPPRTKKWDYTHFTTLFFTWGNYIITAAEDAIEETGCDHCLIHSLTGSNLVGAGARRSDVP